MSSTTQQTPDEKRGVIESAKNGLKALASSNVHLTLNLALIASTVWGGTRTWQLVSGSELIREEQTATLVQTDLLQFLAFIVAWSVLIMTISAWITNWLVGQHRQVDRLAWERQRADQQLADHLTEHPDMERRTKELEGQASQLHEQIQPLLDEAEELRKDNDRLKELNQKLMKLVTKESEKSLY